MAIVWLGTLREAGVHREAIVMRTPETAEASMARINGILIRGAIAAVTVLPLLR